MKMLLESLLTALCLLALSMPALAQKERAYAPEDLGGAVLQPTRSG
jgi:hypothetical protein